VHGIAVSPKTLSQDSIPGTLYGLAVDWTTGDVYLADARGFAAAGEMRIFTEGGVARHTDAVQRGPGVFPFKR
jgi:hypothetical protein